MRAVLASYLVQFQLNDEDPARRADALQAIERDAEESHYAPLLASVASETDPDLKARKARLVRLLAARYEPDIARRVDAILSFKGDLGVDARAALNPLLASRLVLQPDETANIQERLSSRFIEGDMPAGVTRDQAIALLQRNGILGDIPDADAIKAALIANMQDGSVGGYDRDSLDNQENRLARL